MNLKNYVTKSKTSKSNYVPHKIRSRPFKCLTFPIFGLALFIFFWFILCPLLFVALWHMHYDWPKEWAFYYWIVALIVFVILLSILVCTWRYSSRKNKQEYNIESSTNHKTVLTKCRKDSNPTRLYTISLNTIQRNQDKLEKIPNYQQNNTSTLKLEDKLAGNNSKNACVIEKDMDKMFRRCSLRPHLEQEPPKRPETLVLRNVSETTTVDVHSASSPLTPRELFFWDLIQNANKTCNSQTHSFIEHEKEFCALDDVSLNSSKCVKPTENNPEIRAARSEKLSSTEYFIANIQERRNCSTEAFLFVDGGQSEKCLKIRTDVEDGDDDVFKN